MAMVKMLPAFLSWKNMQEMRLHFTLSISRIMVKLYGMKTPIFSGKICGILFLKS